MIKLREDGRTENLGMAPNPEAFQIQPTPERRKSSALVLIRIYSAPTSLLGCRHA